MGYKFHKRLTDFGRNIDFGELLRFRLFSLFLWSRMVFFGGNCYIGVVLCFVLSWMFLLHGWALYEFSNHAEFHESTTMHGFLMSL